MDFDLTGRVAIVTGGAQGLGFACCTEPDWIAAVAARASVSTGPLSAWISVARHAATVCGRSAGRSNSPWSIAANQARSGPVARSESGSYRS